MGNLLQHRANSKSHRDLRPFVSSFVYTCSSNSAIPIIFPSSGHSHRRTSHSSAQATEQSSSWAGRRGKATATVARKRQSRRALGAGTGREDGRGEEAGRQDLIHKRGDPHDFRHPHTLLDDGTTTTSSPLPGSTPPSHSPTLIIPSPHGPRNSAPIRISSSSSMAPSATTSMASVSRALRPRPRAAACSAPRLGNAHAESCSNRFSFCPRLFEVALWLILLGCGSGCRVRIGNRLLDVDAKSGIGRWDCAVCYRHSGSEVLQRSIRPWELLWFGEWIDSTWRSGFQFVNGNVV
jgi:hypothetical protein